MSAQKVNDRFIELLTHKNAALYKKVYDGGFMVIKLNTGEMKVYLTGQNLSDEEMNEIMPVFRQAVKEINKKKNIFNIIVNRFRTFIYGNT